MAVERIDLSAATISISILLLIFIKLTQDTSIKHQFIVDYPIILLYILNPMLFSLGTNHEQTHSTRLGYAKAQ